MLVQRGLNAYSKLLQRRLREDKLSEVCILYGLVIQSVSFNGINYQHYLERHNSLERIGIIRNYFTINLMFTASEIMLNKQGAAGLIKAVLLMHYVLLNFLDKGFFYPLYIASISICASRVHVHMNIKCIYIENFCTYSNSETFTS